MPEVINVLSCYRRSNWGNKFDHCTLSPPLQRSRLCKPGSIQLGVRHVQIHMQEVKALARPDSSKAPDAARLQGVHRVSAADLSGPQDELVSVLKGIDCVMCILPPHLTRQQVPLANAALTAKVKRFVPNMWSATCPPKGVMKIREWVGDRI